jgi:hypothetical protein
MRQTQQMLITLCRLHSNSDIIICCPSLLYSSCITLEWRSAHPHQVSWSASCCLVFPGIIKLNLSSTELLQQPARPAAAVVAAAVPTVVPRLLLLLVAAAALYARARKRTNKAWSSAVQPPVDNEGEMSKRRSI